MNFFKFLVSLILVIYLFYNVDFFLLWQKTSQVSLSELVGCCLLFFFSWIVAAYKWNILLPQYSYLSLLKLCFVGQFYSTVLPGQVAGEIVKTYRLAKNKQNTEQIIASVFVDRLTGFIGLFLLAVYGIFLSENIIPKEIKIILLVFLVFLVFSLFLFKIKLIINAVDFLLLIVFKRMKNLIIVERINLFIKMWNTYLENTQTILYSVFLGVIFQLLATLIIFFTAKSIGISIKLTDWYWIVAFVYVALFFPISIAGIGVREGIFVWMLSLFNVPKDTSLTLSILVFSITLIGVLSGGLIDVFDKFLDNRDVPK